MAGETILVVEDNPANLELVTILLQASGYTVRQAWDAESGIEIARSESPDLILLDVGLPGMDGLTAARALTSQPGGCRAPIVILTAHAMRGDRDKALAAGCAGYISKPIDTREFIETVREFLDRPRAADQR